MRLAAALAILVGVAAVSQAREPLSGPSRAADKGCVWTRLGAGTVGLELLYQKCDFGFRRIDFDASERDGQIYEVFLDTATRERSRQGVITVFAKKAEEKPEAAIERVAFGALKKNARKHCAVAAKRLAFLGPDKKAYTILPDAEYAAEIAEKAGDGIPESACGPLGDQPDGLGYFEFHPDENAKRFVYVDFGQEEHPLFDEKSLLFLP